MKRRIWMVLFLLVIIPGLLFTVSCAKKVVQTDTEATQMADETATMDTTETDMDAAVEEAEDTMMAEAEDNQAEMDEAASLEEERLEAEARAAQERLDAEAAAFAIEIKKQFEQEDIYFGYDKANLGGAAQVVLRTKADFMGQHSDINIIIEGHCDSRGTNEYNLALGDRRAEVAKAFLINLGISATRITTISYGEERPVDSAQNEAAWAKNRRAHFVIE
jgi:peptidoglycan-associated lipoprotein